MNEYYSDQAGSGIATFSGQRFQKGHGFFGRLLKGSVMPLIKKVLPYLGREALDTGADIFNGLKEGKSFKSAAKSGFKKTGKKMIKDALIKLDAQDGEGFKRRRRRRRKTTVSKVKKTVKPIKVKKSKRRRKAKKSTRKSKKNNKFLF